MSTATASSGDFLEALGESWESPLACFRSPSECAYILPSFVISNAVAGSYKGAFVQSAPSRRPRRFCVRAQTSSLVGNADARDWVSAGVRAPQ